MSDFHPTSISELITRYLRTHTFSIMAICNILGDTCYFGYAFSADLFVSYPKLVGALFAIFGQAILLAYGDKQAQRVSGETGELSVMLLRFRAMCQAQLKRLPRFFIKAIEAKPVGIPFAMLALNGVGLVIDAFDRMLWQSDVARIVQGILGMLIVCGTGAFSLADFMPGQKIADSLVRIAPRILAVTTTANLVLAFTTFNPFLLAGSTAFLISNWAGFYAKIDKKSAEQQAPKVSSV